MFLIYGLNQQLSWMLLLIAVILFFNLQSWISMEPTHIEHIGIAVKCLDEAILFYEDVFGLKCYNIEEIKEQKVKTAFFKIGQTKIELLESTDPEGPIGKFIEKKGEGIHHIAFTFLTFVFEDYVGLLCKNSRR